MILFYAIIYDSILRIGVVAAGWQCFLIKCIISDVIFVTLNETERDEAERDEAERHEDVKVDVDCDGSSQSVLLRAQWRTQSLSRRAFHRNSNTLC